MRLGIARACWLDRDLAEIAFHTMKKTSELLAFEGLHSRGIFIKSDAVQFIAPAYDENSV